MKMKHNFAKGGNAKVKSVGMRISIIISILLIITLGAKTAFDTVRSYNLAISTNKDHKYEETRKLAKQLEQKFISAYYSARTTEGAVSTMMKNIPTDQRQRVFIARLIAQEADLYFMDEPLAGIDKVTEKVIIDFVKEEQKKGKTAVIVHHDLATIREYFDHVVIINKRVVAAGKVDEVFTNENLEKAMMKHV